MWDDLRSMVPARWLQVARRRFESPPRGRIFLLGVALVATALVILHRPDAVTNPQFFAEDGVNWYSQAYTLGPFVPFLTPYAGYLQVTSRIVAGLSLLVPIGWAPLVFVLAAIGCQVLPVVFLASDRLATIIPNTWLRLALGFAYLNVPGASGIDAILTDAQWHLAVLSYLIMIAPRPHKWYWRSLDIVGLAIAGLSGPFALFLAPLALVVSLRRSQDLQQWLVTGVLWATASVTAVVLVINLQSERATLLHHASGTLLTAVDVVGVRIVMVAIIGTREAGHLQGVFGTPLLTAAVAGGLVLGILAFYYASFEARIFLAYGAVLAVAALVAERSIWTILLGTGGSQYWFVPILAWVLALTVLAWRARSTLLRGLAVLLCTSFVLYGIPHDWRYPPLPNEHFARAAATFQRARPGQEVLFREVPPGWVFELVKK
ncbi:MAG: hypothetical protein WBA31_09710 [Candidatus Dormiibacterota bacterium]